MKLTRKAVLLFSLLALSCCQFAEAAATRINLLATAAQTATGVSARFPLSTAVMCQVSVDVTAVSGSSPALDIWLQGSYDGGTTWVDLAYTRQLTRSATAADVSANTNKRNINGASSASAANGYVAIYDFVPTDNIRLSWVISGTTPSFTLRADAVCK